MLEKESYIGDFLTEEECDRGLMVFVCGPSGHGTSSVINGLISTIQNERTEIAIVSKHKTSEFRRYRAFYGNQLDDEISNEDPPDRQCSVFAFADFVGLDDRHTYYEQQKVRAALFGLLPKGQKFEKEIGTAVDNLALIYREKKLQHPTDAASVIIWVVDIRCRESEWSYLSKLMEDAKTFGIPSCLVLTKYDILEKDNRNSSQGIEEILDDRISHICKTMQFRKENIIPVQNYTTEIDVEPTLSYTYLKVLNVLADEAIKRLSAFRYHRSAKFEPGPYCLSEELAYRIHGTTHMLNKLCQVVLASILVLFSAICLSQCCFQ